jgi:hypothetical protein
LPEPEPLDGPPPVPPTEQEKPNPEKNEPPNENIQQNDEKTLPMKQVSPHVIPAPQHNVNEPDPPVIDEKRLRREDYRRFMEVVV